MAFLCFLTAANTEEDINIFFVNTPVNNIVSAKVVFNPVYCTYENDLVCIIPREMVMQPIFQIRISSYALSEYQVQSTNPVYVADLYLG